MPQSNDHNEVLEEVRALMAAAAYCSSPDRSDVMLGWACDLLDPLVVAGHPAAVWLQSNAKSQLSDVETDPNLALQGRVSALMVAADSGVTEAQFFASLHFFDEGDKARSNELCAKAAAAGHVNAMWCHGLDLISGNGVEKNEAMGLKMIEQAASLKFDGAIRFMADALALGQHGFDVDNPKAAEWHRLLSTKDVIRY